MKKLKGTQRLALFLSALCLWSIAEARTVKIISADTLELRNIAGQELVVIEGNQVEIRLDNDVVRARRVEFNRTSRTLTLVGQAYYHTERDNQTLTGDNLVVDLGSEALTGQDVLISNSQLEIRGQEVERVPGQLRANGGYFTPCAKCGRTTNDYAFRAEQLVVYPGDRLIAYRAQLLIAEHPVLYLPVLVLPLNDQSRQPRLVVGSGLLDGRTIEADLPFAVGSSFLGTTMLRYYQNRTPQYGGGIDLHGYAPTRFIDRLDLYALALPKPFLADGTRQDGYDKDLKFSVKGRIFLSQALTPLDYSLLVGRRDIGLLPTDPERGVTRADFAAKVEYPLFYFGVNYNDRFGPELTTALPLPLRKPEVYLDPKPFSVGDFNFDFKFTAGSYEAASNPLSRIASSKGVNYSTTRLEEAHQISYTRPLWKGAEFSVSNAFVGRYYGNGARTVQLDLAGKVTQRWGGNAGGLGWSGGFGSVGSNSFSVEQKYIRYEGTSPFAFDAVPGRRLSAPLTLSLSTVPTTGATFGVVYTRDAFLQPGATGRNETLSISGGVSRLPISASYGLNYDFSAEQVTTASYTVTVGDPDADKLTLVNAAPAVPATPTSPALPARAAYYKRSSAWPFPRLTLTASGGYDQNTGIQPLNLKATVTGDTRSNYFSVSGVYNLGGQSNPVYSPYSPYGTAPTERGNLTSVNLTYNLVSSADTVLNPFTVAGNETLGLRYPRLNGNHTLTWRGYTFATAHDLNLEQGTAQESGNVSFSVGNLAGSATNWTLTYGGPYDLNRQGFTRPRLTASLNATQPGQRLSATAVVNTYGLDQPRTELSQASLSAAWQKGRFAVAGRATFSRLRYGPYPDDHATDTLVFDPLRVGLALGKTERPDFYLTASLRQTFTYLDGVRQNPTPLAPVFGLTWNRCCWAMQGEYDMGLKRLRIAIGLPGQTFSIFDRLDGVNSYPLQPFVPTY